MIQILDNKLPHEILHEAISCAEWEDSYRVMHPAGNGSYGFKYSWMFCPPDQAGAINNNILAKLWEEVKKHLPVNSKLHRGYINAHTYGVEDTIHVDDPEIKRGLTVIVYLCNAWYPEWFGQTMFFEKMDNQDNEIIQSVIPKYNRFVVFNKEIPHCVAPLSRRFAGIRLTCMFKVELLDDSA